MMLEIAGRRSARSPAPRPLPWSRVERGISSERGINHRTFCISHRKSHHVQNLYRVCYLRARGGLKNARHTQDTYTHTAYSRQRGVHNHIVAQSAARQRWTLPYHGILIENRGSARPLEALRRATGDHTTPCPHCPHAHRSGPHTLTHTLSLPDFCMFCKSYLDLVRC